MAFTTLRTLELRLLRCTLTPSDHPPAPSTPSPPSTSAHPLHHLLEHLVESIESGHYIAALSSDATKAAFNLNAQSLHLTDSSESAQLFYDELLPELINSFVVNYGDGDDDVGRCYRGLVVMAIAIAAFLAFTQCNITGPFEKFPAIPLATLDFPTEETGGYNGSWVEWERWAAKELMSAGSDLCAKFSNLQYIIFAKKLLMRVKDLLSEGNISSTDELATISWWLARVLLSQQRLLDGLSSSLSDLLQVYKCEYLDRFGTTENLTDYWRSELSEEDALTMVSLLHLEAGIMELIYRRTDPSRKHFELATLSSRLDVSVSGALGFRTVHQVEPRAQLRLVAGTGGRDVTLSPSPDVRYGNSTSRGAFHQHPLETYEASDVLMAPRFTEDENMAQADAQGVQNSGIACIQLKIVHQAVILAQCLSIEKTSRSDELENCGTNAVSFVSVWKMAPYIEAIDGQEASHFIIKYLCDILRVRWESTRSRTKQRALLMMDKLVEGIYEASPGIQQRLQCFFGVNVPTIPALRKEYAELLVSSGVISEAVKVYEDLEMWDNLIHCYRLLDKKAAAVELIKKRLSESPHDPRLWCTLGDATNEDAWYKKALEVSGNRSARAQRSLARSAYARGDYETSKVLWERAMALNSLYRDGWFALGAAALKARDLDKGLEGFTRAVQLEPENGEAWNNIASLHMVKGNNKAAFIAFKEALKFKRESWQMWENFSHVAADVGNLSQALEAVQKVLDMTRNQRFETEFLERMTGEIETRASDGHSLPSVANSRSDNAYTSSLDLDANDDSSTTNPNDDLARKRETENLIQFLGKILRQIVQSGGNAEIWGLYARWHKMKGDLAMCSEALLKQVRSYQGSDLWKERERFVKFAHASLELCEVYQELYHNSGSRRELFAAEMHLKNTIKQAADFSDTQEFKDLVACLDEVQKKLQAQPMTAA